MQSYATQLVSSHEDFEVLQREALSIAVRENLQKFPVEMQASDMSGSFRGSSVLVLLPDKHLDG